MAHGIIVVADKACAYLAHESMHIFIVACKSDCGHARADIEQVAVKEILLVEFADPIHLLSHFGEMLAMGFVHDKPTCKAV